MTEPDNRPIQDVRSETADALDRALNRMIVEGVRVVVGEGENARVETVDPPAQILRVIHDRCKFLNHGTIIQPGSSAGDLLAEAQRRGVQYQGKRFPLDPVDTSDAEEHA